MLKIVGGAPRMAIFDRNIADEYGLETAVVFQELIQDMGKRWPETIEGGVLVDKTNTWYRFDDDRLKEIFSYIDFQRVNEIIENLEQLGWLTCWRSLETDIIWMAARCCT